MPGSSPMERLQAMKARREALIAARATLEEKEKANQTALEGVQLELKGLGVTEEALDDTIRAREQELAGKVEQCSRELGSEEAKVVELNRQLGQVS